jgi:predicted enzyme related to lactoylglutathione lyase
MLITQFGTLCLLKIPTSNIYRAQIFYSEVFGWSFKRMEPSSVGTPRAFFQKGSLRGYLIEIPKNQSLSTSIYQVTPIISVEDIDGTTARIKNAGGQVLCVVLLVC